MDIALVLFIIAAVLFGVAAFVRAATPVHFGWFGALFLALGLALGAGG